MIILGVDPGITSIGYAVLNTAPSFRVLASGLITVSASELPQKLVDLHKNLQKLLRQFSPDSLSLEKIFFSKNTKTALAVSEARGVILLTTALAGVEIYEYTPLEVKKTVTGDGNADKAQMKKMIHLILKETVSLRAGDDVFDAIGLALTCFYQNRY